MMPRLGQHVFSALLLLLVVHVRDVSAAMRHFEQWYPEWGFIFDRIVHDNCSTEYELFENDSVTRAEWHQTIRWLGPGYPSSSIGPLVNCIVEHSTEYIKVGMAAANVVLGLTPGLLACLGSPTDETSILSICGRRPFLALCLSAGSPAVVPLRLFQYRNVAEILDQRPGRLKPVFYRLPGELFIYIAEYIIVFAAIANVVCLGYELGSRVVLIFAPELTYLVLLWIFLGVVPHMVAAVALKLRIRVRLAPSGARVLSIRYWIAPWEVYDDVHVDVLPETLFYGFLSGVTAILISAHIIFGTLVFSSMLFISVQNCIPVIARFIASAIACRVILLFELARLRHLCHETGPTHYQIQILENKNDRGGEAAPDRHHSVTETRSIGNGMRTESSLLERGLRRVQHSGTLETTLEGGMRSDFV